MLRNHLHRILPAELASETVEKGNEVGLCPSSRTLFAAVLS